MKKLPTSLVTVLCACALLSGCATMRYPKIYKVEGKEVKEFKELDDEKALKLVVLIYNLKYGKWEDGIARSIALQEYIGLLSKRKTAYLKNSGVFEMAYEKVNIRSWEDSDLIKLYESLLPKTEEYYTDAAPEMGDVQNAERIMYLTASSAINTEMKRRDNTRNALAIAGNLIVGVLTAALSML